MLGNILQVDNLCFTGSGETITSGSVQSLQECFCNRLISKGIFENTRVVVVSNSVADLIGAVAGIYSMRLDGILITPDRMSDALTGHLEKSGYIIIRLDAGIDEEFRSDPDGSSQASECALTVLTSGSTGHPKLIRHRFEDLITLPNSKQLSPHRWLLSYTVGSYAWYQMVMMHLFCPGQNLIAPDLTGSDPGYLWQNALSARMDACSSTPSFWRFLRIRISGKNLRKARLKQITLGGEPVDQAVLDELTELFPSAKLTHIYATTELGVCVVVNDRKAGFPKIWLNFPGKKPCHEPGLRVENQTLWVNRLSGEEKEEWIDTGDLVEIKADRVLICGRKETGIINVGGRKVIIHQVEHVLESHPQILWCRVSPENSSLLGQMVGADLVTRDGKTIPEPVMVQFCRNEGLADWMIPRFWRFRSEPQLGANFKSRL